MYVHVLSWLWTSCDTSMYSKRVNVHIMCTNADRSSKERQYHQSWAHRHVTDVYEDLGSCWILVDTGIEWYTMQTELWDICRIENNMHTLLWRHQLVGCIPCMYIVDDLVAIKVEIDQSNWYGSISVLLRPGSFNVRILTDNHRWIHIIWRLDAYDMQR